MTLRYKTLEEYEDRLRAKPWPGEYLHYEDLLKEEKKAVGDIFYGVYPTMRTTLYTLDEGVGYTDVFKRIMDFVQYINEIDYDIDFYPINIEMTGSKDKFGRSLIVKFGKLND